MSKQNWQGNEPGCFGSLICCSRSSDTCAQCSLQTACVSVCQDAAQQIQTQVSVRSAINNLPSKAQVVSTYSNTVFDLDEVPIKAVPLAERVNRAGINLAKHLYFNEQTQLDPGLDLVLSRVSNDPVSIRSLLEEYMEAQRVSRRTAENMIGRALSLLQAEALIYRKGRRVWHELDWG